MEPSHELSSVDNTNELDFTVDPISDLDLALDAVCEMDFTTSFSLSTIDSLDSLSNLTESYLDNDKDGETTNVEENVKTEFGEMCEEILNTCKVEESSIALANGNDEHSKEESELDARDKEKHGQGDVGELEGKHGESNGVCKGDGDAQKIVVDKTEQSILKESVGKSINATASNEPKVNKIKKCRVKLPMKGEKFRVKFVDNFNVPHKLHLKNIDKVEKRKLNMLLAKKLLQPLTCMPMSRLKEKSHVLVKFRKPAKLVRAQVKWIDGESKIEVQDLDSGALCRVTRQDIFVLDDEQIANIYPRLFVCTLSEFDGKDILWNPLIRDLYISTLRSGQISIEVRTYHHTVQTHDVHLKLLLDEKKFINVNEWLANSFIPYLVYLKTSPASVPQLAKYPTEIFFPYVKLLKE